MPASISSFINGIRHLVLPVPAGGQISHRKNLYRAHFVVNSHETTKWRIPLTCMSIIHSISRYVNIMRNFRQKPIHRLWVSQKACVKAQNWNF